MKIFCPCDNSFSVNHNEVINLDNTPEVLTKIADGSFLKFECPKCGRGVRAEIKTRIEWPSKNEVLLFVPEVNRIACLAECSKKTKGEFEIRKDETPVIGFAELAERLEVIKAELDPHTMEVLKFFILDSGNGLKGKKIKLIFNKQVDDKKFEFFVHGLRVDEIAVIQVPVKLYNSIFEDIRRKKKNEAFKAVFLENYLSYQNIITDESED